MVAIFVFCNLDQCLFDVRMRQWTYSPHSRSASERLSGSDGLGPALQSALRFQPVSAACKCRSHHPMGRHLSGVPGEGSHGRGDRHELSLAGAHPGEHPAEHRKQPGRALYRRPAGAQHTADLLQRILRVTKPDDARELRHQSRSHDGRSGNAAVHQQYVHFCGHRDPRGRGQCAGNLRAGKY